MSYQPVEENTLGVILGRGRRREPDATRRVIRAATPRRSGLGTGFIGIGAAVICAVHAIYSGSQFVALWTVYPNPIPALAAWVILMITLVTTFFVSRVLGDQLRTWMFVLFLVGLAASVALDLYAIWPLHDVGRQATAAITAGVGLTLAVTLRRISEIAISAGVLGVVMLAAMVLNTIPNPENLAYQVTTLAFIVLPAVIAIVIVRGFRRLVQVELDRVLVQSTVSAPRFAVGMMASEELARLDLAAEELLDAVATGRTKLPLGPKTASISASLATELRLHLIEGRRETWLYHAISESDLLGKSVTLTDKSSLAGLLDPGQRDGLLSTAWLLLSDTARGASGRSVQIGVGPATASEPSTPGGKIIVPISLTTTGVPRNRVDPATWEAIRKVGQYSDSTQNSSLRVDIKCLVENPANA